MADYLLTYDLPQESDHAKAKQALVDAGFGATRVYADHLARTVVFGNATSAESGGCAGAAAGFESDRTDTLLRSLTELCRQHIDPPVELGFETERTEIGIVLAVHVPEAWAGPHMVTFDHGTRFYRRRESQVLPMDVHEIREGFVSASAFNEKVDEWRGRRIAATALGALAGTSVAMVHIVPLPNRRAGRTLDMRHVDFRALHPINRGSGHHHQPNVDGVALRSMGPEEYVQVYRDGSLEGADTFSLLGDTVSPLAVAIRLVGWLDGVQRFYTANGVPGPYAVMLTLAGVKGKRPLTEEFAPEAKAPLKDNVLLLPNIVVDGFDDPVSDLEQLLHILWQSMGIRECPDAMLKRLREG